MPKTGRAGVDLAGMGPAWNEEYQPFGMESPVTISPGEQNSGRAHSSAIVWSEQVFVTTCLEDNQKRQLISLDRKSGDMLWARTVLNAPLEKKHLLNSYASGTPVTDGELIFVTFLDAEFSSQKEVTPGSIVVAAYDFAGQQRWIVRPGRFSSVHGFCTSPILFENLVIINGDHDGDSYICALDKKSGEIIWRTPREHKT